MKLDHVGNTWKIWDNFLITIFYTRRATTQNGLKFAFKALRTTYFEISHANLGIFAYPWSCCRGNDRKMAREMLKVNYARYFIY